MAEKEKDDLDIFDNLLGDYKEPTDKPEWSQYLSEKLVDRKVSNYLIIIAFIYLFIIY